MKCLLVLFRNTRCSHNLDIFLRMYLTENAGLFQQNVGHIITWRNCSDPSHQCSWHFSSGENPQPSAHLSTYIASTTSEEACRGGGYLTDIALMWCSWGFCWQTAVQISVGVYIRRNCIYLMYLITCFLCRIQEYTNCTTAATIIVGGNRPVPGGKPRP